MKKVFIAFVAMLSLVLMPMGVNAASYKDYFTIQGYYKDESGRGFVLNLKTDKATHNEDGTINELKGTFMIENAKGEFEPYKSENFSLINVLPGPGESSKGLDIQVVDGGSKNDTVEARFQLVIDVNFDDYKSKLTIDLDKMRIEENSNGYISNVDEIVTEEIVKEATKVEDKTVTISEETSKISKDVLAEIKANKNKVTYESKKDDKVVYAWTFDGAKITNSDLAVDLGLVIGSSDNEKDIKAIIPKGKEAPLVLHFKHNGNLPTGTSVKVNVGETYKNNEILTLYYYNETAKKLEEAVTNIKVKDGFAEFTLEHCSDYVLVKDNKTPNNSQTSSMNIVLYSIIAAGSLAGIVYFVVKSKKKIA